MVCQVVDTGWVGGGVFFGVGGVVGGGWVGGGWGAFIQQQYMSNVSATTVGRFKKAHELLNLRALKFSPANKMYTFQCMDKVFCVEFQRVPLKFHTIYLPIH